MVHRCQARTLAGMVEPSPLVLSQREGPVAPFDMGARGLEHLRERGGFSLQRVVLLRAQRPSHAIGRPQRGAEALGQRPQRRSCGHRPRRGHAIERP